MARTTATISFQALELKGSLLPGPPCWKRFPSSTAPRSCCSTYSRHDPHRAGHGQCGGGAAAGSADPRL